MFREMVAAPRAALQLTTQGRRSIAGVGGLCLATVAACSGGGKEGGDITTPPAAVASLSVGVDTVRLTAGRTLQLSARALDATGQPVANAPVTFTVRNGTVAAVSAAGTVSAQRLGRTTLRIASGSVTADVPLVVQFDSLAIFRRVLAGGPFGVAVAGDVVTATQKDAGTVARGSIAGKTLTGGIRVGSIPTDVAINAAGTEAYVTNQYSNSLGIVNLATGVQETEVVLPYGPYRSVMARDGKRVWVTTNAGPIYAVDVATRRVVDSLPGVGPTNGFAIAPGDTLAYASNYYGEVREFDLRTRTVKRTLTAPGTLQEVVVSGDSKELYVANESGGVEVFDLGTGTVTARLALGQVFGMAMGPDGYTLFVARSLDGAVSAVDRETRKILFSVPLGGVPRRAKFNADGSTIVVANEAGWVDFLR